MKQYNELGRYRNHLQRMICWPSLSKESWNDV